MDIVYEMNMKKVDQVVELIVATTGGDSYDGVQYESVSEQSIKMRVASGDYPKEGEIVVIREVRARSGITRKAIISKVHKDSQGILVIAEYIDHTGLDADTNSLMIEKIRVCPVCIAKLPGNIAFRQRVLPFLIEGNITHVASSVMATPALEKILERFLKTRIKFWQCNESDLIRKLNKVYGSTANNVIPSVVVNERQREKVNLGDELLYAANLRQSSDIHIDPNSGGALIRFRTDGQLEIYSEINISVYSELVNRLKVMSKMDIAEKRIPQDGRFSYQFPGIDGRTDIRVATLPTKYGERVTMRLSAMQTESLSLDNLGFNQIERKKVENFLLRTQGMMIMTGPTGSGKTTTLYASIRMLLNERRVNIITVEDPIEYEIEGIAQSEVDDNSHLSFATALRSILRHDPDVVMIGEIRDKETADIAIKAALTGHMVLGTLHANSAAASVTRLLDMKIEPYLVAAALRLTVAQRLIRKLCEQCRIQRPLSKSESDFIKKPQLQGKPIYDPAGCIYCANKGYSGRIGLYEVMELNSEWARGIAEGGNEAELVANMREAGVKSLLDDAVEKLLDGKTAFEEVIQIASSW